MNACFIFQLQLLAVVGVFAIERLFGVGSGGWFWFIVLLRFTALFYLLLREDIRLGLI